VSKFEQTLAFKLYAKKRNTFYILVLACCFISCVLAVIPALIIFFIFKIIKRFSPDDKFFILLKIIVILLCGGLWLKTYGLNEYKPMVINNFRFMKDSMIYFIFFNGSMGAMLTGYFQHFSYYLKELFLTTLTFSMIFGLILDFTSNIKNHWRIEQAKEERRENKKREKESFKKPISAIDGTSIGFAGRTDIKTSDQQLNTQSLIFGTNGSGKTVLQKRFYRRAIKKGYPLIVITAKPDHHDAKWLRLYAEENGRAFYSFDTETYDKFDLFSFGTPTQVTEKIVGLQQKWSNEYYKDIAKSVILSLVKLLRFENKSEKIELKDLLRLLDPQEMLSRARETENEDIIADFSQYRDLKLQDLSGIRALLNSVINGDFAEHLSTQGKTFKEIIEKNGVCYFALDIFKAKELAQQFGVICVNELKLTLAKMDEERAKGNGKEKTRYFLMFDEFRDFATHHAVDLMNKGRSKGAHVFIATQSLEDLGELSGAVMDNANTLFCFRVNDSNTAEGVATFAGTKKVMKNTDRISDGSATGEQSSRLVNEFKVSPDTLKYLENGECYYISKEQKQCVKVKVHYDDKEDNERFGI
jgi:hypothetical protein